jgi:hypothetical protein
MLGEQRMDALSRLVVGGLYLLVFTLIVAPVLFTVGFILGVVDIIWQGLFNREGIAPMNYFSKAWDTQYDNVLWVFTGKGEFQLALA